MACFSAINQHCILYTVQTTISDYTQSLGIRISTAYIHHTMIYYTYPPTTIGVIYGGYGGYPYPPLFGVGGTVQ